MNIRSVLLCAVLIAAKANAQQKPFDTLYTRTDPAEQKQEEAPPTKKFDPKNIMIGGTLGASFGDYTFVNVSPQVGYYFNQYITAGVAINYVYSSIKYYQGQQDYAYKYNYSYAGLGIFGRFFPLRFLFVSAQPELNYNWGKIKYNDTYYPNQPDEKVDGLFVPSFLIGGGAVLSPTGRGGMMISIQYDVIQYQKDGIYLSPYGRNPYLNIGFAF